jgi:hypothetical protein
MIGKQEKADRQQSLQNRPSIAFFELLHLANSGHYRILRIFLLLLPISLSKPTIPRHERLQHVRDQRSGIHRLAIRLRVQRSVTIEVGFQAGRAREGQLRDFMARQRAKPQFFGRVHREVPLLKKSG